MKAHERDGSFPSKTSLTPLPTTLEPIGIPRHRRWWHYLALTVLLLLVLLTWVDLDTLKANQRQNVKLDAIAERLSRLMRGGRWQTDDWKAAGEPSLQHNQVSSSDGRTYVDARWQAEDGVSADIQLHQHQQSGDDVNRQAVRRRLPTAIIIGARKSGTRALLEALNLHPDVKTARFEVHFFDSNESYARGLDWYRNQMPFTRSHQITIEKTPGYFTSSLAPERVYKYNPATKLILILRNPVVRTISDYSQVYYNKLSKGKMQVAFDKAVFHSSSHSSSALDDDSGDTDRQTDTKVLKVDYKPVRNSLYVKHMRRWLRYFPQESFLLLDGDRFTVEPLAEIRRAERFLGLQHEVSERQLHFNATKGFYCFQPSRRAEPQCLGDTKGRPHVNVSSVLVDRLRHALVPYNERFFDVVHRRFDWH